MLARIPPQRDRLSWLRLVPYGATWRRHLRAWPLAIVGLLRLIEVHARRADLPARTLAQLRAVIEQERPRQRMTGHTCDTYRMRRGGAARRRPCIGLPG